MRVLLTFHSMVTRSNHRLAEELALLPDVELTVVAPTWWPEEGRDVRQEVTQGRGYRLVVLPTLHGRRPMPNLFVYGPGLSRVIRETAPHLIDLYAEPFSLAAGQMLALRRLLAPRAHFIFYSAQNIYRRYPLPFSAIEQWSFRAAGYAHVCNTEAGEVLRRKGYGGPLRRIPLGADRQRFLPAADREEAKRVLGLQGTVIGFLGRLHPQKGVQDLLHAFARLQRGDATLLLVGDGPHREALEAQVASMGLAHRVVFAGAIDRLAVPPYLQAMDCLVVPSRTMPTSKEQFGRIIVEAFLSEVPVVGSSSGAIPELIGDDGLVFPEGDVARLASALSGLLDDPASGRAMAARARARALRDCTWESVAAQRYHLYQAICAART